VGLTSWLILPAAPCAMIAANFSTAIRTVSINRSAIEICGIYSLFTDYNAVTCQVIALRGLGFA
jgi:hypothetical protein